MIAAYRQTIGDLQKAYTTGDLSPVEVVEELLARIDAVDSSLHSYLAVRDDEARLEARAREREIVSGTATGPLHGVPVALKDLLDVAGMSTTGGSVLRRDNLKSRDAQLVENLRRAGAIVVGKNNLYEFGLGLPTDGEWPTAARNPWDLSRIPGGSSSGSAVAVASGLCFGSYGTDTGGSIRGPASYCGVVGLKPTQGIISLTGCMPLSWTLDHIGPLGRTVADVAALLGGASGIPIDLGSSVDGFRVGVPYSLIEATSIEDDVSRAFEESLDVLRARGCIIENVELPDNAVTEAALLTIIGTEGLAGHLSTLAVNPEAYGRSARERLSAGLIYSGVDYVNAMRVRDAIIEELDTLYSRVHVIASPVTAQVAPTNAEFQRNPPHRTPFTGIHNLTGGPAVSVPAGFDRAGMPIGIQLAAPRGEDARVLTLAHVYERETPWHTAEPTFVEGVESP